MEHTEIIKVFDELYNKMATSNKPKYMQVFGETMKCMMHDMVELRPDVAMEYLDKLEAINWYNYLSKKEANMIVSNMTPKGGWNISEWNRYMETYSICTEEEPYYNKWAMYVTMNMIYSDSSDTIAKIAGKSLIEMPEKDLFEAIHLLALDKLEDQDGMFDIRAYFHV